MDTPHPSGVRAITLAGLTGIVAGRLYPLLPPLAFIGRAPTCQVEIPSAQVSRLHCKILLDDPVRVVEDRPSTNGTYVNGAPVDAAQELRHGDVLKVGPCEFSVRFDASFPDGFRPVAQEGAEDTAAIYTRMLAGDAEALGQLYYRFLPRLMQIAERRLGGQLKHLIDCEDLAQEALVDALLDVQAYDFQQKGSFLAFLRNRIEHLICDRHRHWTAQKRDARRMVSLSSDNDAREMAERGDSRMLRPEAIADLREQWDQLRLALDRLPAETRSLIQMARIEGRTSEEIGEALGLSADAARMRVKRALEELQRLFGSTPV